MTNTGPDFRKLLLHLVDALNVCEGNRGAFSCHARHDCRCPKGRAASAKEWRGEWVCECGREELDVAWVAAEDALRSDR